MKYLTWKLINVIQPHSKKSRHAETPVKSMGTEVHKN